MNITDEPEFKMSDEEIELRAHLVLAQAEAKEYKQALDNFKQTGRPITLPNQLSINEFNQLFEYMTKQKRNINNEISRIKKQKKNEK